MQFVNKQNHIARPLELIHESFHPLLELSPVLCACNKRCKVKGNNPLVIKHSGYLTLDNLKCKAFGDGRLSDSRLSNQHWIVLFTAAQNLGHTFDLFFASDDWIELVLKGKAGKVTTKVVEDGGLGSLAFSRIRFFLLPF